MKKPTKKQAIVGVITAAVILAGAYGILPEEYVQMILEFFSG